MPDCAKEDCKNIPTDEVGLQEPDQEVYDVTESVVTESVVWAIIKQYQAYGSMRFASRSGQLKKMRPVAKKICLQTPEGQTRM